MKIKSVFKYSVANMVKSIGAFYGIFISVCILLIFLANSSGGSVSSSGVELSSAIFIFIAGLNSFKENFYFMKSNNVSRRDFLYGVILSMIPIAFVMSFIDVIVNRVNNLFIPSPTNYDMIYGNVRTLGLVTEVNKGLWVQSNSIETLVNTFLFQGAVYTFAFALGFVITILYYKSNSLIKVIISVTPVALIILLNLISDIYPSILSGGIKFIQFIFGWNTLNPYAAILTFIISFISLSLIARILTKRVVLK